MLIFLFKVPCALVSLRFNYSSLVNWLSTLHVSNSALNTDNNPANYGGFYYIFSNLARAYIVVGCCRL